MPNISVILGQRIRLYRKERHLSQEKLAELSCLHPTYIGQLERGEKNASMESIHKICVALQIPMSKLVEKLDEYAPDNEYSYDYIPNPDASIPLKAYELISMEKKADQETLLHILQLALRMKN